MKSLITEKEKLRIRSMHINEKFSLLKEGEFFDLLPIDPSTIKTDDGTQQVSTCKAAPELKTLADEGKFRTWVKTTYPDVVVSGVKLGNSAWKNPPTVFCNSKLGILWKSVDPITKQTYGQLYLTKK